MSDIHLACGNPSEADDFWSTSVDHISSRAVTNADHTMGLEPTSGSRLAPYNAFQSLASYPSSQLEDVERTVPENSEINIIDDPRDQSLESCPQGSHPFFPPIFDHRRIHYNPTRPAVAVEQYPCSPISDTAASNTAANQVQVPHIDLETYGLQNQPSRESGSEASSTPNMNEALWPSPRLNTCDGSRSLSYGYPGFLPPAADKIKATREGRRNGALHYGNSTAKAISAARLSSVSRPSFIDRSIMKAAGLVTAGTYVDSKETYEYPLTSSKTDCGQFEPQLRPPTWFPTPSFSLDPLPTSPTIFSQTGSESDDYITAASSLATFQSQTPSLTRDPQSHGEQEFSKKHTRRALDRPGEKADVASKRRDGRVCDSCRARKVKCYRNSPHDPPCRPPSESESQRSAFIRATSMSRRSRATSVYSDTLPQLHKPLQPMLNTETQVPPSMFTHTAPDLRGLGSHFPDTVLGSKFYPFSFESSLLEDDIEQRSL